MARAAGTTTERGYGHAHRVIRAAAIAAYHPGQPCAECGQPMTDPPDALDLAHDHANGGYKGLAHSACNRADGASRGNHGERIIISAADRSPACVTCGVKYHYAARSCAVCGVHYHPSGGQVRTCGRACGMEMRRRKYAGKLSSRKPPRRRSCDCTGQKHKCYTRISYRNCVTCGTLFVVRSGRQLACSDECREQRQAAMAAEYRNGHQDQLRAAARRANDRKGEARGWPRGKGAYNVGSEPWNRQQ